MELLTKEKLGTCCIDILKKKSIRLQKLVYLYQEIFFKTAENGSFRPNEVKHIRRALFLSKTTVTLYPAKVIQYINIVSKHSAHPHSIYDSHTYPLPSSERSINSACLNFTLAHEYRKFVENSM
jgi:hypothetical protein